MIVSESKFTSNLRLVKRTVVSVVGGTVLLIGIALLVLPGPAFIVIPIGLAILATEYAWARRWLRKAREYAANLGSKTTSDAQPWRRDSNVMAD
jgi:tellurite resistance protein TerC